MEHLEKAFGTWVLRHRGWILLSVLLVVALAASGLPNLHFTTNYRVFFSPENPQLQAFEGMERTYTQDDNVLFLLLPEDGDVFSVRHLAALEWLTEQSWQIPYSIRVDSLSNFQHTEAEADDLLVRDLARDAAAMSDQAVADVRSIALAEPLLLDRMVPADGAVSVVNVTIQLPRLDELSETPQVVDFARSLQAEFRQRYPDIDLRLSGIVVMNAAFSESSQGDIQTLVPISFGIMLLVLGVLLRSLVGVLATVAVVILSIIIGLGVAGHLGYPVTPPSATSPNLILTIAIASSVHVLVSFYHEMRKGLSREAALSESLRINLQPVFLTSLTTAIGFLSLNFSEVPPFQHLGNIVAVGVVASFFLSVTFLPALMSLLPARVGSREDVGHTLMLRFGDFVVRRRKQLLPGMSALVLILLALVPLNELNDVFVRYFGESVDFRQASDELDKHLGGLYRIDYSLRSGETNGIADPDFLHRVETFADWLRQQPEVVQVTSLTDILKRLNRNLHGDDPDGYRLPEGRESAAQYLLLYEMSLPYGLDLNNQIDVGKTALRVSANMKVLSTREVLELERRATTWLAENAPELGVQAASPTLMFTHIGHRNIHTMLIGTTAALVLISLILVLAMRSLKIGLISMIPNLVPAAMGFGVWGLLVGQIGLSLSIVTGMTLGIVVDDTVHFLSKYLRARREDGLQPEDAVRYAFDRVGMALFITTVVLMAGFLVLALSSFYLNAGMGLLTAIVLGFALLADFLFLPPLLIWLEQRSRRTAQG